MVLLRVIDCFGSLPTAERLAYEIRSWGSDPGYSGVFRAKWAKTVGLPMDVVEAVVSCDSAGFRERSVDLIKPYSKSVDTIVTQLEDAGIHRTVLHNPLPTPGVCLMTILRLQCTKHAIISSVSPASIRPKVSEPRRRFVAAS